MNRYPVYRLQIRFAFTPVITDDGAAVHFQFYVADQRRTVTGMKTILGFRFRTFGGPWQTIGIHQLKELY